VCPASLLGNWQREVHKFAPGTPVRRYHGPQRTLDGAETGFVLTTYGTMRLDAERLGAHRWSAVVADEAQHVKNPHSSTAKALRLIPSDARIALTGTPVENNLSELWAVLDWTTPGLLGGHSHFRTRWVAAIEAERAQRAEFGPPPGEEGEYGPTAKRLAELVRPFLLRRKKSDPGVAPELPPKTEQTVYCEMEPAQRKLYNDLRQHYRGALLRRIETDGLTNSLADAIRKLKKRRDNLYHGYGREEIQFQKDTDELLGQAVRAVFGASEDEHLAPVAGADEP